MHGSLLPRTVFEISSLTSLCHKRQSWKGIWGLTLKLLVIVENQGQRFLVNGLKFRL